MQVAGSALLGWDMVHIGHVEVFLPADQGVIRPSENDQIDIHGEPIGHGRKLFLHIEIVLIDVVKEFDVLKALWTS